MNNIHRNNGNYLQKKQFLTKTNEERIRNIPHQVVYDV